MSKIKIYNPQGQEIKERELEPAIFSVAVKPQVISEVARLMQANARQPYAHTKGRSDVKGGGRKPWRQKGTGRARHGSIRSPLWAGGGVTFGPTKETNYTKKINKKVKQKAFLMTLSSRAQEGQLVGLSKLQLEKIKTKDLLAVIDKLPKSKGSSLLIIGKQDETLEKSARNLSKVSLIAVNQLNLLDILRFNRIIFTEEALDLLEKKYNKNK